MRSLVETRKKWATLFSDEAIGLDLRQAVKDQDGINPCEEGLRSICWKAFLLYGPVSQSSWPKKLAESRSAYSSLRDHFLRFIEHPDDIHSSIDPLADDSSSPWATLRQDEVNRAEIFQDVERCLQDNFFFREPTTQKILLDILFIYSKLHPDTGYRQGMHELLAPILWVVDRDAIDSKSLGNTIPGDEGDDLMRQALDSRYIEHDAFTLFCAVMQTTKSFYEIGETSASSPIVARSVKIHEEILYKVDPELADHLQAIEILPQIFLIRWIRLLFGREFEFDDVLSVWDLLFAENLNLALIDSTCVAMLLRIRWQLMEADYSSALTLLLRYPSPTKPFGPSTLVQDAIYLDREKSTYAAANLVGRYTGRRPEIIAHQGTVTPPRSRTKLGTHRQTLSNASLDSSGQTSRSPIRFQQYQKGLESAFQEVSGTLQRRAEAWNITKTVRGAVGEIKRNVTHIQSGANSPRRSGDIFRESLTGTNTSNESLEEVSKRINYLENRNKALAKMLGGALEELRAIQNGEAEDRQTPADRSFNIALAKIQFVQVYLEDPEIPIPPPIPAKEDTKSVQKESQADALSPKEQTQEQSRPRTPIEAREVAQEPKATSDPSAIKVTAENNSSTNLASPVNKLHPRPSLAESSFSWILGEERHRSSFISSVSAPPEERRGSDPKVRPKQQLFNDNKKEEARKGSDSSKDDGFTMSSLRGRVLGS